MLNDYSHLSKLTKLKPFAPLLWDETEGNSQGNCMFVLVEILLPKNKILLIPLFHNRSKQFLSLQLWVFPQNHESDCKISAICITLKDQDSEKGILFHHCCQHGNVLCLASPVIVIRSWGLGPRICSLIALNTLCMAPQPLSPCSCLCQTRLWLTAFSRWWRWDGSCGSARQ